MKNLGQPDPNVKVPAAVRAAGARADELFKLQGGATPSASAPPPQPKEDAHTPAAPPAPPAPPAEADKDAVPSVQATEVAVTADGNQPTTEPASPAASDDQWERRFNGMKGRYEQEKNKRERAEDELVGVMRRVAQLEQQLADMASVQQQQPKQQDTAAARLITPEEEQEYGHEFLNVVGKKAAEAFNPELQALRNQIATLQERLDSVGARVAVNTRDSLLRDLTKAIPNWKDLNADKNFLRWLSLPDTYSGVIRHELLNQAYERNDTPRVLAFFQGFLSDEAAPAPVAPEPHRVEATASAKVPLEEFAAPGRAKTAATATPVPAEKPLISRAQIAKFYVDVTAGKYRGRDEEKNRLEQMIFEAEREGRIQ